LPCYTTRTLNTKIARHRISCSNKMSVWILENLIEVFIPYREMGRHIHWILNAEKEVEENANLKAKQDVTIEWKKALLAELNFVGIVAALVASVVTSIVVGSSTFSWHVRALWLSALLFALTSISIAAQQAMALTRTCYNQKSIKRIEDALSRIEHTTEVIPSNAEVIPSKEGVISSVAEVIPSKADIIPSKLDVYVWQIPVILLSGAILLFVIGLNIWVFEAAVREQTWGDDKKTAVFFGVMATFAFAHYLISCVSRINLLGPRERK